MLQHARDHFVAAKAAKDEAEYRCANQDHKDHSRDVKRRAGDLAQCTCASQTECRE